MRQFGLAHPLWMAFFSKDLYRDAAHNWGASSFLYLAILLLVTWVPAMVGVDALIDNYIAQDAPDLVKQIPTITIRDGRASADVEQPYCIFDPDTEKCLVIIDTKGSTTSLEGSEAKALLTETTLILSPRPNETESRSLAEIEELVIDQDSVNAFLDLAGQFLAVLLYPFAVLGSFAYRTILTVLYAVVGIAFTRLEKVTLGFASLCSLSIMAMSPSIVIQAVVQAAGSEVPKAHLVFLAVTLVYLLFGIRACSQPDSRQPATPGQPPIEW